MVRLRVVAGTLMLLCLAACEKESPTVSFRQPPASTATGEAISDDVSDAIPPGVDSLEARVESGYSLRVKAVSGGVFIGKEEAPVLTVYTDYACEYCRTFSAEERRVIEREFVDPGRIGLRLVFLPRTPEGSLMASVAMCALEQHRFEDVDRSFTLQPISTKPAALAALAKETKLNLKTLQQCLQRLEKGTAMETYVRQGAEHGVTRTPTFSIGDRSWIGLVELDEFRAILQHVR